VPDHPASPADPPADPPAVRAASPAGAASPARRPVGRRSPRTRDDDLLAAFLTRMWALASGHPLPRDIRPDQLSEEELIGFWADDVDPAASPASGQVCAMLAFDIVGFTRPDRDEETRIHLHKALYEILREALQGSGLPWDRCHHEDRGDGALVIAPPDIPAHGIIHPFPDRLHGLIRLHNRMSSPAARIQVRAAAHIGPVYRDDHGLIGDDINLLFRMLDARPLRTALAGSGTELALAISGYMHDCLVRRHPTLVGPALFRQVKTRVKGTKVDAWIHLPGTPPQLEAARVAPGLPGLPADAMTPSRFSAVMAR
jgi:class 3 adenylate cyclase